MKCAQTMNMPINSQEWLFLYSMRSIKKNLIYNVHQGYANLPPCRSTGWKVLLLKRFIEKIFIKALFNMNRCILDLQIFDDWSDDASLNNLGCQIPKIKKKTTNINVEFSKSSQAINFTFLIWSFFHFKIENDAIIAKN